MLHELQCFCTLKKEFCIHVVPSSSFMQPPPVSKLPSHTRIVSTQFDCPYDTDRLHPTHSTDCSEGPVIPSANSSFMAVPSTRDSQYKVHDNSAKQSNSQDRRSKPIIKATLATLPYALRPPVKREQRINHGSHGNECKETRADLSDFIAEVEEPDCETAEDDSEVEPRKEGALIGEEDFWLDACGEGNALAWGLLDGG